MSFYKTQIARKIFVQHRTERGKKSIAFKLLFYKRYPYALKRDFLLISFFAVGN